MPRAETKNGQTRRYDLSRIDKMDDRRMRNKTSMKPSGTRIIENSKRRIENEIKDKEGIMFTPLREPHFIAEEVLTRSDIKLEERMTSHSSRHASPKIILSWNAGHTQGNLGGCPDWNCKLTHDRGKLKKADAILLAHSEPFLNRTTDQYVVYFSQESPVNSRIEVPYRDFFNMSLGFRHDTPASSPYGYTVKLKGNSRYFAEVINATRVQKKKKGAAWFVSHCPTNSKRERYVKQLQKDFPVDVYGDCGTLKCARGGECENMLDDSYHFYIAFENSICDDYITEKLWNQGYRRDIIPIVLKRSLVEQLVPPNSFIAADDFNTTKDLAAHLHYLMFNKSAYTEYFQWRREYKVVFLDGKNHDALERPWGFCQLCRLLWEKPRPHFSIQDFNKWWDQTCEKDGELVRRLLGELPMNN
ncbi:hypothetical protein RB195_017556 [Necator americanus]|uniref:Fucosyltransferase n=1 Tax=Necator americanus TaxID=51031 RepID=A0ABR1C5S2_NECAM